jgi:tRNA threonylcarbamoyladenosine biosynthesis protein TsaE
MLLESPPRARATVVSLVGDLGAGKTTFIQGLLAGLGARTGGASPTFVLMRRTPLKKGRFSDVFHLDVYRLDGPRDLAPLEFKKITRDPRHLVLVEWADKIRRALPRDRVEIRFAHGSKKNERRITIT